MLIKINYQNIDNLLYNNKLLNNTYKIILLILINNIRFLLKI